MAVLLQTNRVNFLSDFISANRLIGIKVTLDTNFKHKQSDQNIFKTMKNIN